MLAPRLLLPVAGFAAILLGPGAGSASGQELVFAAPELAFTLPPTSFINTVESGDYDEDGQLDVVLLAAAPVKTASVLLGQVGGGFVPGPVSSLGLLSPVLLSADLDGDGHLDLLGAGTSSAPNWLMVSHGAGDGSFGLGVGLPAALPHQFALEAAVGDLDLDDDLDLVATKPYAQVLRNAGDGTFTSDGSLSGEATAFVIPLSMTLADLAADGTPDLVVGMSDAVQRVHHGLSGGALSVEPVLVPVGSTADFVSRGSVLADVTGDGILDLTLAHMGELSLLVRPGLGDGNFGPTIASPFLTPGGFLSQSGETRLGDFDGDGTTDAAVLVPQRNQVAFLRGLGGGAFQPSVTVSTLTQLREAVVMDVDQDGRTDLIGTRVADGVLVPGPDAVLLRNATYTEPEAFVDLGHGLAGTRGFPVLLAEGSLTFGTPFSMRLENGLPGALPWLVAGLSALELPFKGGVMWPQPDFVVPGLPFNVLGVSTFAAVWLESVGGFDVWIQFWFADAGAPKGFAATTGVRAEVP